MRTLSTVIAVAGAIALLCIPASGETEKALVAHYAFDEGQGSVAHDKSGNRNDGVIHGAKWVRCGAGYALEFSGKDSVDCGKGSSLDITDVISVEAWAQPAATPTVPSEWYIVGKSTDVYALTYYLDGGAWWYISGGDNASQSPVSVGQWHHLVGTCDGKNIALYVDGELKLSKASKHPRITSRKDIPLVIGPLFSGRIDDVRVWHRVLTAEEVRAHYKSEMGGKLAQSSAVEKGETLKGDGFTLKVGDHGGMELSIGQNSYGLESAFSEPGDVIKWNRLTEEAGAETVWISSVKKPSANEMVIEGKSARYSLQRKVKLDGARVRVQDTLANIGDSPVGIIVQNHIIAPQPFAKCFLGGMAQDALEVRSGPTIELAANPTIFVSQGESHLGVVAEDNVSHVQFEATAALNRATASIKHFGMAPGKSCTLEWTVYPLAADADYFTLVNLIRKDWNSNFTVDGPFELGAIGPIYVDSYAPTEAWRRVFQRKPVKFMALTRMFEYDIAPMTRQEYKQYFSRAMKLLKEADPDIKVLASIETFCPSLLYYPDRIKGRERLDAFIKAHPGGSLVTLPQEINKFLEEANAGAAWPDSLYRTPDGLFQMEIFRWGGTTMTAFYAFPAPGNYQHQHLMDQVKYLIDDVGVDGIYFDGFAVGGATYGKWDGFSVDLDPQTGKIVRQYTNTVLAGIGPRAEIAKYILSRGKALIGNGGTATVREEQSVPAFRFIENDPQAIKLGEKPPLNARMCSLQLGSPVALMGLSGSAQNVYRAVISYLRHGLVCYYYNSNFPDAGEGSGDYGPFRHMFPITPVALHEGWIEGKERIITCVSGNYVWRGNVKPVAYLFDAVGREKPNNFAVEKAGDGWTAKVTLKDWQEIAVIENAAE